MIKYLLIGFAAGLLVILVPLWLASRGAATPGRTIANPEYQAALKAPYARLEAGSEAEQAAVQRVIDLFTNYSHDALKANVRKTYSAEVFFRDGFKQLDSAQAIEDYILHGLNAVRSVKFEFLPTISKDGDYLFRWTMAVTLKKDAEEAKPVLGSSHIRFNEDGKVVFHQDYWDPTDLLYSRIPVANWLIEKVHERL